MQLWIRNYFGRSMLAFDKGSGYWSGINKKFEKIFKSKMDSKINQ